MRLTRHGDLMTDALEFTMYDLDILDAGNSSIKIPRRRSIVCRVERIHADVFWVVVRLLRAAGVGGWGL